MYEETTPTFNSILLLSPKVSRVLALMAVSRYRSVSADGTYFVYNCGGSSKHDTSSSTNSSSTASTVSNKNNSKGIDRFGGISEIPEDANPNFETLQYYLYRYLYSFNIYPFCSKYKELHCEDIPPNYLTQLNL